MQSLAGSKEQNAGGGKPGEKLKLYPERPSSEVDNEIAQIEAIRMGAIPKLNLTPEEKEQLLKWEEKLGIELEKIAEIKSDIGLFYPEYFLTEEGSKDFERIFPDHQLPATTDDIARKFYLSTEYLKKIEDKVLDDVSSNSSKHADQLLEDSVLAGLQDDGTLQVPAAHYPKVFGIMLSPEKAREKLSRLLVIKKSLKDQMKAPDSTPLDLAKKQIAKMYLTKVNEMLVKHYEQLFRLQRKQEKIGEENLSDDEKFLLSKVKGKKNLPRTQAVLDKFVFGASREKNERGDCLQISNEIMAKLSAVLDEQADFSVMQKEKILAQGLDPAKVLAAEISPEQRKIWGERVLDAYGLHSEIPADQYVKTRTTPAADDKWQFVLRKDRKTKAINPQQKVVLDYEGGKEDVIRGLIVTCGHEIEGHVLQHHNKAKIPLRLFKKLGGDRKDILAEGGAVHNENTLIRDIFGYERAVASTYLLAMEAKRRGGDYLDCLIMAYGVELSKVRSKYDLSKDDEKQKFKAEITKALKALIPRVKRIFNGIALSDRSGSIPNTKDTVYLEQEILMQKLAQKGLTKLGFVGGMNLRNIATLMQLGLIDFDQIEEPRLETKKIWEEIRSQYQRQP